MGITPSAHCNTQTVKRETLHQELMEYCMVTNNIVFFFFLKSIGESTGGNEEACDKVESGE